MSVPKAQDVMCMQEISSRLGRQEQGLADRQEDVASQLAALTAGV